MHETPIQCLRQIQESLDWFSVSLHSQNFVADAFLSRSHKGGIFNCKSKKIADKQSNK